MVGGTGLYFKALTEGLVKIPNIPDKYRDQVRSLHKKIGPRKFYSKLIKLDPLIKKKLNLTDSQRVMRAFEIKSFTKRSMYEWFKNTKSNYEKKDFYKIYIDYPRDELIKQISFRTSQMIDEGAILEAKKFLKLKVPKNKTASKAIGLNEISEFLNKKIQISELIEKISIKTRQYAKRQTTWGRGHMSDWNKIKSKSLNQFLKKI